MEEIAPNIYLEDGYPGVVLSACKFKNTLLLVDSPFRPEDVRSWRASLASLNASPERILMMLDTHIDRTIGIRAMDSIVVGHENAMEIIQGRPTSGRGQDLDTGAECEAYELPSSIRWVMPAMTYSNSFTMYFNDLPMVISHRPGGHLAGSWVEYEAEKLLFVGDSVMVNQPPFLAWSDLELWLEELSPLLTDSYKGFKIITSRNGVVRAKTVERWILFLTRIKETIENIVSSGGQCQDLLAAVPELLKRINFTKNFTETYENRLKWGLEAYYRRHFLTVDQSQKHED